MSADRQIEAGLRAQRAQLVAALHQVDALLSLVTGEPIEPGPTCPRCGAGEEKLAEAGDVLVCGHCGANIKAGEVIGG